MTTPSVIQNSRVVLRQNVIYRARLVVVAPFGPAATQDALRSALGDQGFANVRFYDSDALPADWPPEYRSDDSGFMAKTFWLEGVFTLSDRQVPLSELGSKVDLQAMWVYLVPVAPVTAPSSSPTPVVPVAPPEPELPGVIESPPPAPVGLGTLAKVSITSIAMLAGYWSARFFRNRRTSS